MTMTSEFHSQAQLLVVVAILLILLACHGVVIPVAAELITHPGCQDKCGNISIPFPFGMRVGCFLQEDFQVTCDDTLQPPRAFLASRMIWKKMVENHYSLDAAGGAPLSPASPPIISDQLPLELFNISAADSQARVYLAVSSLCYINGVDMVSNSPMIQSGEQGPFHLSGQRNVLVGVGSNIEPTLGTTLKGTTTGMNHDFSCTADLKGDTEFATNGTTCTAGLGCCQATLPPQATNIKNFGVYLVPKSIPQWKTNPCSYAMVVEKSWYSFSTVDLVGYDVLPKRYPAGVPVVLDFAIVDGPCPADGGACVSGNSSCANATGGTGYVCKCLDFYGGNPYIANGCQDIDECTLHLDNCSRGSTCKNRLGGYDCPCNSGLRGDGKEGPCTEKFPLPAKITVGIAAFIVVLVIMVTTHQILRLKRLYNQNGGQVLEGVKNIRIYTRSKLKKITNNYKHVIGEGHFGKVYKGTIDKQQVAVKKSIKVDKDMRKEFIEEVKIQSRMRHKNIVLLLGCCLEMEVPSLVYEFIVKGSLYDVLFKERDKYIPLDTRLEIALGSAEGLTYMHSAVENTIRHGDVKSANILLDENFTPKVADFGTSKLLVRGRTEKADWVTGDMAYIDPEYMANGTLTQKSDVYSFGIVLIELITRRRATYDKERSYVANFVHASPEKRARELFDKDITSEKDTDLLEKLSGIVVNCVKPVPEERLDMKQVEQHLTSIIGQVEVVRRETSGSTICMKSPSPTSDEVPLFKAGKNEAPRD